MFKNNPLVKKALLERNEQIANFWISEPDIRNKTDLTLVGKKALVIDAEDTFTEMCAQMLRSIGLSVTVRSYNTPSLLNGNWDLFVMGPGPGNPSDLDNQKIQKMRQCLSYLTTNVQPFFAICLSHQILCVELGFEIEKKSLPSQGRQQKIDIFGSSEYVGFYNTYIAKCDNQLLQTLQNKNIDVSFDLDTREVHALKSHFFYSVQFHPESVLTLRGIDIIKSGIQEILAI